VARQDVGGREFALEDNNGQLNGMFFTGTCELSGGGECRFIRLVNISKNHWRNDGIVISAWDIFGTIIE
jgi:hypothetical protein